ALPLLEERSLHFPRFLDAPSQLDRRDEARLVPAALAGRGEESHGDLSLEEIVQLSRVDRSLRLELDSMPVELGLDLPQRVSQERLNFGLFPDLVDRGRLQRLDEPGDVVDRPEEERLRRKRFLEAEGARGGDRLARVQRP